ncbi:MAG TPA: endonuclease/exonuclease/phosphatase family protein, partial [Vicinamibacterales bacterium]|nr:endonuclease/exonuclease/phosphatase family protein [Vicinamibacterales bacterium]
MRRRLMPLLFALLFAFYWSAAGIGGSQQGDPQAKPRSLRVMTYNIHHGSGNIECTNVPGEAECALDLDAIAEVIRMHDADVVGLQEVDRFWRRSGTVDQPAYLAKVLGMHYCYG